MSLLVASCTAGQTAGSAEGVATDPIVVSPTPEELRDQVVQAIESKDEAALKTLWPVEAWDTLSSRALEDFIPSSATADCGRSSEDTATCFIFEDGRPFVLGLTMELQGSVWQIRTVTLDSTN